MARDSGEPMDTLESDVPNLFNERTNQQPTMQIDQVVPVTVAAVGAEGGPAVPEAEENDRSEATFSFKVENFTKQTETLLSPPCIVRNLPWKIMMIPKHELTQRHPISIGFFLQCNGESTSTGWTCNAVAELRLLSFKPNEPPIVKQIKHLFCSKENDWGFQNFIPTNDIYKRERGYIENDTIMLEVHVIAEAPHGVLWDSKKHTGYVGLKNQGATCYMNSLLQTLFFTNQLRKAVYKMPTEADDSNKSVALALQRVFHELQFSNKPVGTKKLTKSFGWDTLDSFMQHDVQEFLRVLLDKLESKMKGTSLEGTIPKLFEGKMLSYIKCKNVEYSSERTETFYDIQLSIKGMKNIYDSFKDYIATETLDGDNKYDAGEHGLQDAEKGVVFLTFPPVLHLHLMRFQYDPVTDNSVKFNDRFEFYEEITLDNYLSKNDDAKYKLHAVLVHSGDNHGGHYVVYINPNADGKWCKFDDDVVSKCTKQEAIDHNYGGKDEEISLNDKQNSNAYMLVYIRCSELDKVLEPISETDIPSELSGRLKDEKRLEEIRKSERPEANLFLTIHVILEEFFEPHHTTGLFCVDEIRGRPFKIRESQLVSDLVQIFSDSFKVPQNRMRIWTLSLNRQMICPQYFNFVEEMESPVTKLAKHEGIITILLEIVPPDSPLQRFPEFDRKRDVLVFLKYYDAMRKQLNYIGMPQFSLLTKLTDLVADMNKRLGHSPDTELVIYQEYNGIQKLINHNDTLEKLYKIVREYTNSLYLIFEKRIIEEKVELPTCDAYIQDQMFKVEVTFIDKSNPNDRGFVLELSSRNSYDQMAVAVAKRINSDPYEIQFFECHREQPGQAVSSQMDRCVEDFLLYSKSKVKKIFYQKISININELANKKQFKCLWVSQNLKDEKELVLYLDKKSTVRELLDEAAKQIDFSEDSTRKLRLLEIENHRIRPGPDLDTPVEKLHYSNNFTDTPLSSHLEKKIYRIEEIPHDELCLNEDEMLIPVAHFWKDVISSFGTPFFIKVREGESYGTIKQRIQKKLNVPEKEWKLYKFQFITVGKAELIQNDVIEVSLAQFKTKNFLPYIGLEHVNKSQKRSHYNLLEKAIKIFN